jgi:polysaccharide biosynthesis/export protein
MQKRKLFSMLVLLCLTVVTVAPLKAQQQQGSVPAPTTSAPSVSMPTSLDQMGVREYQLGTGDMLEIRVFGEPQFDGTREINSDGNIEIPFVGAIPARCRSVQEVKTDVTAALARFLRNPQVDVLLKERRSRPPAVVSGAVRVPQQFQIYRQVRLLELLAYTGGVTDQANGTIEIFHTAPEVCPQASGGATTTPTATAQHANTTGADASTGAQAGNQDPLQIPFDVYNLSDLRMGRDGANPFIRPGDAVFVREASPIYVTGAVVSPQGVYLREGMTLMRAIASVGGLRREARASSVRIYRRRPNSTEPETIVANINDIRRNRAQDIALQPYDIIDVGEASPFSRERIRDTILGFVTNSVGTLTTGLPTRVLY